MSVFAECDCGHTMKLPETAGGKRIRCPECSGPISVPSAGRRQSSNRGDDDYGDDGYGDDDDWNDAPRPPSRSASSRGGGGSRRPPRTRPAAPKRSLKKPVSKQDSGLGVGLAIGIVGSSCWAALSAGFFFLWGIKGEDPNGNNVAQANNGNASNAIAPNGSAITPNTTNPGNATNVTPNAGQNNNAGNANTNAVSANPNGTLWAVVSNFKSVNAGIGAFNKSYSIDYRLVSGGVAPGTKIVLYISEGNSGIVEHYNEVDISMKSNGSVSFRLSPTFGPGRLEAHLAIKKGHQKWKPISGKMSVGGGQSSAQVPKTLVQQAGKGAAGKAVVLGNARQESNIGQTAYVVDFQIQQKPSGGFYFCVIKDGSGQGIEFDVSTKMRLGKNGDEGTLGGRPMGINRLSAHIEKRSSPLPSRFGTRRPGPAPTIISNTLTFK